MTVDNQDAAKRDPEVRSSHKPVVLRSRSGDRILSRAGLIAL
jgi:hypothetical protein